ncbi:hypothetical protein CH92_07845 [Stutzerimonas stutzeri]|uniref:DUF4124 domain-containing protein n=1 Tax=Stutzerimonas stutzeri TaxID=316 RepID=W8RSJ7_STUST|nr:DUF4124 domain-containing protein [Stutzerimonas stutzeri]AHL75016.1 hypothetical protein CH92_07845 [Stutzerimonas stutzeri]MCQ4331342.1 DUF4124 domain-containing protein [Stutzerimonas stutzeri]
MNKLFAASCCALLFSTTPTFATSVYRCVDEAGKLTFSQQGCPVNQTAQIQEALNPTPSSGKAVPMAKLRAQRKLSKEQAVRALTVVGEQDDGCGNRLTSNARRNAMISQQIRPGMTRADIESTFGTPDTVTSRNGQVQYRYSSDKGRTRTVSFDEHGCVGGKR